MNKQNWHPECTDLLARFLHLGSIHSMHATIPCSCAVTRFSFLGLFTLWMILYTL